VSFCTIQLAHAQEADEIAAFMQLSENDSIYLKTIEEYIRYIEEDSYEKPPKQIFIQYENFLFKIPKTVKGYEIVTLGYLNKKKVFRRNKNKLRLIEITPLQLKDGKFQVILTPYWALRKRGRKYEMIFSHSIVVYFEFKNEKLVHTETKSFGI
jgi:hypothetical protein